MGEGMQNLEQTFSSGGRIGGFHQDTMTACLTDPEDIAILLRVDPGFQVFAPG